MTHDGGDLDREHGGAWADDMAVQGSTRRGVRWLRPAFLVLVSMGRTQEGAVWWMLISADQGRADAERSAPQ